MATQKEVLISFRIPADQIRLLRIKAAEADCVGVAQFLRKYIDKVTAK